MNLSKGILHREDQLVQNIESLTRDTEPLIQSVDDIAYKIDEQLNEFERFGKEISRLNNQLDIKSKEIIAYVDDRIWKAELEICNSLKKYTNEIGKVVSMVKERQKIVLLGTPYHSNLGIMHKHIVLSRW